MAASGKHCKLLCFFIYILGAIPILVTFFFTPLSMDNDGAKLLKENQFIISVALIVAEQQFLRNEPRVGKEKFCFYFARNKVIGMV